MKGEVVKLVLETVRENPANIYDALERKGYPRKRSWSCVPRLKKWGYIQQVGKSRYFLTDKGRKKLHRLLYGLAKCPLCDSNRIRLNGKRNGTGNQRYFCNNCGFTWTQGRRAEAIIRALKKQRKSFFIIACEERYSYGVLNYLKEFMREMSIKNIQLIIP